MPNPIPSLLAAAPAATAPASPAPGKAPLDAAFEALQTYTRGSSRAALLPIDEAVQGALRNVEIRPALEARLAAVLTTEAPAVAKEYVCRKLALLGTGASVPALAGLLKDKDLSDLARIALQSIPDPKAGTALRESLNTLTGTGRAGVIQSLGERRDAPSVPLLAGLLTDPDAQSVAAAVAALGRMGTSEAAQALLKFQPKAPTSLRESVADACLACAERLLADGRKAEALALCQALQAGPQPRHIQLAVQRALAAAAAAR